MKAILLAATMALALLYGAPARADAPTVDLITAPLGPDTTVPYIELVGHGSHGTHQVYRLTAGSRTITFTRPYAGKPEGTSMGLAGGSPRAWLVVDQVPYYVGGRTGWESRPALYRLTPDGRLTRLVGEGLADFYGGELAADARYYAVLPFQGNTVSVYRIATGRLVARRTFSARGYHVLGPLVGGQVVVNIRKHAEMWSVGTDTLRHLPGQVQAMAGNTVVFRTGPTARLCSRIAPLDHPRATLWTTCAGFDSLSPDGRHIITFETWPRLGLHDRSGNLLAYLNNGDGTFGWSDGSTVTLRTEGPDPVHPFVAICTLTSCHRGPAHSGDPTTMPAPSY